MNKSKKIEENEIIKPNIIIGLDLTFSFLFKVFFEEFKFLSFFFIKKIGKWFNHANIPPLSLIT